MRQVTKDGTSGNAYTEGSEDAKKILSRIILGLTAAGVMVPVLVAADGTLATSGGGGGGGGTTPASTGLRLVVPASTSTQLVIDSNSSRLGAIAVNRSKCLAYLSYAETADSTDQYTYLLFPNSDWEMAYPYTGPISIVWDANDIDGNPLDPGDKLVFTELNP